MIVGTISIRHLHPRAEPAPAATPPPATPANKRQRRREATATCLAALAEQYPAFAAPRPLAIGVHEQILADWPEVDPRALGDALRRWCSRDAYLASFANASHRVGLYGAPAGAIDDAARAHALTKLPAKEMNVQAKKSAASLSDADLERAFEARMRVTEAAVKVARG